MKIGQESRPVKISRLLIFIGLTVNKYIEDGYKIYKDYQAKRKGENYGKR